MLPFSSANHFICTDVGPARFKKEENEKRKKERNKKGGKRSLLREWIQQHGYIKGLAAIKHQQKGVFGIRNHLLRSEF